MTKRFSVRKMRQHSYSRQGWKLKDLGYVYAVYDREWMKHMPEFGSGCDRDFSDLKYIDNAYRKEVAEFWAKWLNENKAACYSRKIIVPMDVFNKGLELYNNKEA